MAFITRKQWGARETGLEVYQTTWSQRRGFMVHYSAGPPDQKVRAIQDYHIKKGYGDIGYNFLVDQAGNIYEGRKYTWMAVGAHSIGENTAYLGVCFIGGNGNVTEAAKKSIQWLYAEATRRKGSFLSKTYHSAHGPTECPGSNLRDWVKAGMPVKEEDEMDAKGLVHANVITFNKGEGSEKQVSLAWYLQHLETEQDETQKKLDEILTLLKSQSTTKSVSSK